MKKLILSGLAIVALAMSSGCTDATLAGFGALGDEAHIVCWNGGDVVYDDYSTGKVAPYESGISFKSKSTQKYVRVFADCIVTTL